MKAKLLSLSALALLAPTWFIFASKPADAAWIHRSECHWERHHYRIIKVCNSRTIYY